MKIHDKYKQNTDTDVDVRTSRKSGYFNFFRIFVCSKPNTMKQLSIIFITTLLFSGCISTKKYSNFVKPRFEKSTNEAPYENSNISFDLSKLETIDDVVKAEKLKSLFIPAILYWQWENTIKCRISPEKIGTIFESNFIAYADSLGLSKRLNEQKLEITIEQIPASFTYTNKGYTAIFLIAYTIGTLEAIFPQQDQNTKISYRFLKDGVETKSGKLSVTSQNQPVKNVWKSAKKFTENYAEQFENDIKKSAKKAVELILQEI